MVNKNLSLHQLLERYLDLTLSEWQNLLIEKDGVCYDYQLKEILLAKIENQDKSVNGFYYGDNKKWLDKNTRIGLVNLINCGAESVTVQLDDELVDITASDLKTFLNKLEVYAGKCFATTAKHKQAAYQLKTREEILNYDYTSGYPDKIRLK